MKTGQQKPPQKSWRFSLYFWFLLSELHCLSPCFSLFPAVSSHLRTPKQPSKWGYKQNYFSDSGKWPFHTPPIHTPTKCRPNFPRLVHFSLRSFFSFFSPYSHVSVFCKLCTFFSAPNLFFCHVLASSCLSSLSPFSFFFPPFSGAMEDCGQTKEFNRHVKK